jgi:hypothetical protein
VPALSSHRQLPHYPLASRLRHRFCARLHPHRPPSPSHRANSPLPRRTSWLGTRFGAYSHTTQVLRERFPPPHRPPCLCPSKSLTPQSAPSTRAAARVYVPSAPCLHLCDETPANRPLLIAKTSSGHAQSGRIPSPPTLPSALLTLRQFKENPDAWLLVDKILQDAQYPQTKCKWVIRGSGWDVAPLTLRRLGAAGPRQCHHDKMEGASARPVSRYARQHTGSWTSS